VETLYNRLGNILFRNNVHGQALTSIAFFVAGPIAAIFRLLQPGGQAGGSFLILSQTASTPLTLVKMSQFVVLNIDQRLIQRNGKTAACGFRINGISKTFAPNAWTCFGEGPLA